MLLRVKELGQRENARQVFLIKEGQQVKEETEEILTLA